MENVASSWEERAIGANGKQDNARPGLSVRIPRYRYSEKEDGTPFGMFDYEADPYEWRNLVNDPRHAALRQRLRGIPRQDRS